MASLDDYNLFEAFWAPSNLHSKNKGEKDGLPYLFKLYVRYPLDRDSTADYDGDVANCWRKLGQRQEINARLRAVDAGSGSLAYATEVINQVEKGQGKGCDVRGVIEAVPFVAGGQELNQYTGSHAEKLILLQSIADAIALVHSAGIRHGDIKCENILFVRNGRDVKAVVIDFDHSFLEADVPDGEELGGTPEYCSPEVTEYGDAYADYAYTPPASRKEEDARKLEERRKRVTLKSDIYALGVLFYFFLTGQWPSAACPPDAEGAGEAKIDREALDETYLGDLIEAMLKTNPDERPDAEAVAESLRQKKLVCNLPAFQDVWPEHEAYHWAEIAGVEITRIQRLEIDGQKMYRVTFGGCPPRPYTFGMLRNLGILQRNEQPNPAGERILKVITDEKEALWSREKEYRINYDKLKEYGFAKLVRYHGQFCGVTRKGYAFLKEDGTIGRVELPQAVIQYGFLVKKYGL